MSLIHHRTLHQPLTIAGIQIRTSNSREMSGLGQIGALWQQFFSEGIAAEIPNRTGPDLYAVYSNYASDENGEYDYLLGAPVASIASLPQGLTFATIATGEYAVLTTDKGPVVPVLQAAWKRIWSLSPSDLGGKRAFIADYEIYGERAQDPENAVVEVHIGIVPVA
jgi:predicted transcriptional regulator YdeE